MLSRQYISEIRLKRDEVPSFAQYPFSLPAVRHLDVLQLHPAVTFFVGENGSGKSTLLEAIAVSFGFNAEGGSRNFRFGTRESHSELYKFLRIAKGISRPHDGFFLRAESFFNVATETRNSMQNPARLHRLALLTAISPFTNNPTAKLSSPSWSTASMAKASPRRTRSRTIPKPPTRCHHRIHDLVQ